MIIPTAHFTQGADKKLAGDSYLRKMPLLKTGISLVSLGNLSDNFLIGWSRGFVILAMINSNAIINFLPAPGPILGL
jgi:hypothetical protein